MTESRNDRLRRAHPQNLIERRMTKFMHEPPTVRAAAGVIVTATAVVVVVGGVLIRVLDHSEYSSIWLGMWWVLETITTVGYGDLVPNSLIGKLITAGVMLWGIAFLAIITAAITSVFVARAQRDRAADEQREEAPLLAGLVRVDQQLADLSAQTKRLDDRLEALYELLNRKT
jgi:voltage-gated potassium channel